MLTIERRKQVRGPAKIGRVTAVAALCAAAMSCSMLIAPPNGRWNPYDPDNTLVAKTVELKPIEDGYVNQADGAYHSDAYLQVSCSAAATQNASLLLFDLSQVPVRDLKWLRGAQLVLYCEALDLDDYLAIYPIRQAWGPSITYTTVNSASFIDNTIDIGLPLAIVAGVENQYDIFPILQAWYTWLPNYGLLLSGDPNFNTSSTLFYASDSLVHQPRLMVTYLAAE